jgi:ubiquitin-conjugating enzyme E2 J2
MRLCLSMSDYHPETWNPMWSVHTILLGLQSFMTESEHTAGSMNSSTAEKRAFAMQSLAFNCKNK